MFTRLFMAILHPSSPYVRLALGIVALVVIVLVFGLLSGNDTICRGVGYARECEPGP